MNLKRIFILPLFLVFASTTLHAQAKAAVYATFGGEKSGIVNESWATGGTIGAYADVSDTGPIALAADLRADISENNKSILIGPRIAFHAPVFPVKPYAELLVGAQSFSTTGAGLKISSQFSARYVFGADVTILPHIDWRVVDFSAALNNSTDNGTHAKTISTGLVFRF